jgi:hypothetical protein
MEPILEGRCEMPYFTDLRLVFRAIGDRQREFNWLITDLESNWLAVKDGRPEPFVGQGPIWLTGDELSRIVADYEIQFVWAVLSGFPNGVVLDLAQLVIEPYADGNPGFWVDEPRIQHPMAEIEIVCWDSSSTLILSRDRPIGESFRRYFPEAVDLAEYNKASNNRRSSCR